MKSYGYNFFKTKSENRELQIFLTGIVLGGVGAVCLEILIQFLWGL